MIDHRAIEESERILNHHIDEADKHNDLEWVAFYKLQKLMLVPYAEWLELGADAKTRLRALCLYAASLIVEQAVNIQIADKSGPMSKAQVAAFLLARVVDATGDFMESALSDDGKSGGCQIFTVQYDLNAKSDA